MVGGKLMVQGYSKQYQHQLADLQTSKQQINQQPVDQLLIDPGKLIEIDQLLIEYFKNVRIRDQ